jgi:hypothetical protein
MEKLFTDFTVNGLEKHIRVAVWVASARIISPQHGIEDEYETGIRNSLQQLVFIRKSIYFRRNR